MTTYQLTLTREERKAIDWIGNRYSHGDELFDALCDADWECRDCEEIGWHSSETMTFDCEEPTAWRIKELCEESDYRLDCFAEPLRRKLITFCNGIV